MESCDEILSSHAFTITDFVTEMTLVGDQIDVVIGVIL
jgi:hypothetical protein